MSQYTLTEAYSELYNPRLTDSLYYDNLRFVDNLTQSQVQEVMEALIWEFMDYGDTLDEAVDTLLKVFSDDGEILNESLEIICEGRAGERRMAQRKETRERQRVEAEKTTAEREANLKTFAKRDADTARRARRAERSSMIRGALSGAKRNVKGALKGVHKKVTDARSQLAAKGSSAALRAQAALSKVARIGGGAIRGAIRGAREGARTPSTAPSSRLSAKQKTQLTRAAARAALGDVFAEPSKIERLRAAARASKTMGAEKAKAPQEKSPRLPKGRAARLKGERARGAYKTTTPTPTAKPTPRVPQEGRTIHGGPAPKPPGLPKRNSDDPWKTPTVFKLSPKKVSVKDVTKGKPALPPSGKSSGSSKGGRVLTASQRQMKNVALSRRIGEDIDFDTLTEFMVEDLINEGYANTEEDALFILDTMNEDTLIELAEAYLED